MPNILVSTGYPRNSATKTTEIINLNEDTNCQDLADFPLAIDRAVGSNLANVPIICGGWDGSSSLAKCYKLHSGTVDFVTIQIMSFYQ